MQKIEINSGVIFFTDPSGQHILKNQTDSSYLIEDVIDYVDYVNHYENEGIEQITFPTEAMKWFKKQDSPFMIIDPNGLNYGVAVRVPKGIYTIDVDGLHSSLVEVIISNEPTKETHYKKIGYVGIDGGSFSILDGDNLKLEYLENYHFKDDINIETGDSTYRVVGIYNNKNDLLRIRLELVFNNLFDDDDASIFEERIECENPSPYALLDNFLIRRELVGNDFISNKSTLITKFDTSFINQIHLIKEKLSSLSSDDKQSFRKQILAFENWLNEHNAK